MIVNLSKAVITKKLSNKGTQYEHRWLELAITPEGEKYPLLLYIAREHVDFLLRGLRGELASMEGDRPIFDGGYLVQPYVDGLRITHLSGGLREKPMYNSGDPNYPDYERVGRRAYEYMISFPGQVLADYIETLGWPLEEGNEQRVEIPAEEIARIKRDYAPRVRLRPMSEEARRQLRAALRGPWKDSLRRGIKSPVAIARNASNGDEVQVRLWPDGGESFYWEVEKQGKVHMNGGIILHQDGYSVHT